MEWLNDKKFTLRIRIFKSLRVWVRKFRWLEIVILSLINIGDIDLYEWLNNEVASKIKISKVRKWDWND